MSDSDLVVSHEVVAGAVIVRAAGEVDLTNADRLEEAVAATAAVHVVLDLAGLGYVDSAGIRAIDRGYRKLVAERRTLSIVSPPETVAAWTFRIAGFGDGIVVDSLAAALARRPAAEVDP